MLKLVKPDVEYKSQIAEVIEEVKNDSSPFGSGKWYLDIDMNSFEDFIEKKLGEETGENLPSGYVPATTFWAINEENKYIGRISIRHRLTENLTISGGNIGYDIRPRERRKGYASEMLKLCLIEAKKLGLQKVLLTTYDYHIASRKVMESAGAVFQDAIPYEDKTNVRYWINLEK